MSECVVRMEMPQNCWCCPSGHPDWIYNDDGAEQMVCFCNICNTEEDNRWISETEIVRPSWCPIICQLPEGHGRLVDADELSKYWKCRIALMNSCSGKRGILESVEASTLKSCIEDMGSAKTIVPAEAERREK